jgi:hypothetical protein
MAQSVGNVDGWMKGTFFGLPADVFCRRDRSNEVLDSVDTADDPGRGCIAPRDVVLASAILPSRMTIMLMLEVL